MSFFKVDEKCNGCLSCLKKCPASALYYLDNGNNRSLLHNMSLCARCGNCWRICPQHAIQFDALLKGKWEDVATMDLVPCIVCGAPLYTQDLKHTLSEKVEHHVEALCPEHRKTNLMSVWLRLAHAVPKTRDAVHQEKVEQKAGEQ